MKKLLLISTLIFSCFSCGKDTISSGCGYHNGKPLYRGSSGGCYYINSNGNKTYVAASECRCG